MPRSISLLTLLLVACGQPARDAREAVKDIVVPPTPTDFGLIVRLVDQETSTESALISIRNGVWEVRGGTMGDIRSATGPVSSAELTVLDQAFRILHRAKVAGAAGPDCPEPHPLSVRVWQGRRSNESFLASSCHPAVERLATYIVEEMSERLPPPRLPPLREYVSSRPRQCRVPPDFRYVEGWFDASPRIQIEADGGFSTFHSGENQPAHVGSIPQYALGEAVCELGRYDFSVLPVNDEGRSELCSENVRHVYTPGIGWHYTGTPVDLRLHGRDWRLRIGRCAPPLDLHNVVATLRAKALSLYVDR